MSITVADIAALVGGEVIGDPYRVIAGVASVSDAEDGDIVLAEDARYFGFAVKSDAACILTGLDELQCDGKCAIKVRNPGAAFNRVLEHFGGSEALPPAGIGIGAVVEPDANLGENVAIGANCYIGHGATIGAGCVLFPNVYIGDGVSIGDGTKIYPGVTIYRNCRVGKRVILQAGVVIGADGFGYKPGSCGLEKIPHIGSVEIGDDVEVGANSAIDRAKTGTTIIGNGTKIDNLVHIAHNVKIGSHCVIVALSGIAGSAEIGNGVTLAAQTGVKDHVKIEDGCVVAARSGVIGDLAKGSTVSGFPARDHRMEKRAQAARLHLPDILKRLGALEKELEKLRNATEL